MKNKLVYLLCILISCVFVFVFINEDDIEITESLYLVNGLDVETVESLLISDFETNDMLTVGQLLVFYSRITGNNVSSYEDTKEYCNNFIFLPSSLIYNSDDWKVLWRDIVLGNTVFEKVNDNTYSIYLIQGYLKIYLNEDGYQLIKKGLIPPHLYFYSPFSSILDLEDVNLNKKVSLGFCLEVLMSLDFNTSVEVRKETMRSIVVQKVKELTGKDESQWGPNDISLYNYYSLSYYAPYIYATDKNVIENIDVNALMSNISISDFLILYNKLIEK